MRLKKVAAPHPSQQAPALLGWDSCHSCLTYLNSLFETERRGRGPLSISRAAEHAEETIAQHPRVQTCNGLGLQMPSKSRSEDVALRK